MYFDKNLEDAMKNQSALKVLKSEPQPEADLLNLTLVIAKTQMKAIRAAKLVQQINVELN